MLSVLKQEFFIHKKNMLIMSIFIVALYVGCGILYGLNNVFSDSEALDDTFAMWFGFSFSIGTFGALFIALIKGAGSMNDILFKDTGTLMKTIPVNSWSLIGGKMLIGLLEFVFYAILFVIFMAICALCEVSADNIHINFDFADIVPEILTLCCAVVLGFVILQSIINLALTLFATFGRKSRFSKFIIGLMIYLLFYATMRTIGAFLDVINFELLNDILDVWIPLGIFTVVGGVFYAITCVLYEKKVNI